MEARRNKGMDNLLARVAVEESPDLPIFLMAAGRLRERVGWRNKVTSVSNTPPNSLIAVVVGAINDSPAVALGCAMFDNCCRDPISSTSVLLQGVTAHPGMDVVTAFSKSTNDPVNVDHDMLHTT